MVDNVTFDASLIERYNVNGPRYTSYPSANHFTDSLAPAAYPEALGNLGPDARLSLYVHVPFCDTVCYYCACNKIVTNNRRHAVDYLQHLFREMEMVSSLLPGHEVEQLHFGGGTPTYLTNAQFEDVMSRLYEQFNLSTSDSADFSIEIDPRTVDADRVAFLTRLGVNRMSLGIQDFDPQVQLAVNRLQSERDTAAIVDAARSHGVKSVSVDLIYGLPRQNPERFSRTLERVIGLAPDRISLYSYAHLPARFKTQKQIKTSELPSARVKLRLLEIAVDVLTAAGYHHVGMDHFARGDDELVKAQKSGGLHRNFQGYTTHGHCDLIGLGVSAISSVGNLYCQNEKTLDEYYTSIDSGALATEKGYILSAEDLMIRDLIGALMCHFTLDVDDFSARHEIKFFEEFAAALTRLEPMMRDDLLVVSAGRLDVTRRGRFLIRNICMEFDRYLAPATRAFSKTI